MTTMEQDVARDTAPGTAPRSALAHAALQTHATVKPGKGLELIDRGVIGLISLRARDAQDSLDSALQDACGVGWPNRLGSAIAGDHAIRWLAPDHALLSCPLNDVSSLTERLESSVTGTLGVIDVSGAHAVLELGGPALAEVLAKSCAADLSGDSFVDGKVISTVFAKTTATLRRLPKGGVELICRRSFADYVYTWLQQAAHEHGLTIRR